MWSVKLCRSRLTFNNACINTMFLTSCAFDHSMFIFAIRNGFSRFLKFEGGSLVISDLIFASAEYLFNPSPNPIRNVTDITTNKTFNILTPLISRATTILLFKKKTMVTSGWSYILPCSSVTETTLRMLVIDRAVADVNATRDVRFSIPYVRNMVLCVM